MYSARAAVIIDDITVRTFLMDHPRISPTHLQGVLSHIKPARDSEICVLRRVEVMEGAALVLFLLVTFVSLARAQR